MVSLLSRTFPAASISLAGRRSGHAKSLQWSTAEGSILVKGTGLLPLMRS